jgi:hypothetical protein
VFATRIKKEKGERRDAHDARRCECKWKNTTYEWDRRRWRRGLMWTTERKTAGAKKPILIKSGKSAKLPRAVPANQPRCTSCRCVVTAPVPSRGREGGRTLTRHDLALRHRPVTIRNTGDWIFHSSGSLKRHANTIVELRQRKVVANASCTLPCWSELCEESTARGTRHLIWRRSRGASGNADNGDGRKTPEAHTTHARSEKQFFCLALIACLSAAEPLAPFGGSISAVTPT